MVAFQRGQYDSLAMGATARLRSHAAKLQPGSETTAEIRVRNSGIVVDQFTLEVLGDTAAWTIVEPAVLPLFPGAEGVAKIRFTPPRNSLVVARAIPFAVRIKSREDRKAVAVEEGVLEVGTFHDTLAELIPKTAKGSSSARSKLALENRGNTRIIARLTAADPDRKLGFTISPPELVADPGSTSSAAIHLRPRQRFWTGPPKKRSYKVLVHQDGLPTISVDGTMRQEALLPRLVLMGLTGSAGLLLMALALWFAVLRPTIESAVTAALAAQLSAAKAADATGARAPTTGQSALAMAANPLGGDPWSDRLAADRTITVAESGGLSITDLIFQNPSGRTGSLQLLRFDAQRNKTQTLLALRLENFRDLEFHFVTPIIFKPKDKLQLACEADPVADGSSCDAAVYYSGYLKSLPGQALTSQRSDKGSLIVTDDASAAPISKATARSPGATHQSAVTFSAAALSPVADVGNAAGGQTVVVTNTGDGPLAVRGISISGPASGDYSQSNNCVRRIGPGASCSITINFRPRAYGPRNASLTLFDDAAGGSQVIALRGSGAAPHPVLSNSFVNFGGRNIGSSSAPQNVVLSNDGTGTLSISGLQVAIGGGDFSLTSSCGSTLRSGASCIISVTFTPQSSGPRSGGITISDNVGAQRLTLSGVGT